MSDATRRTRRRTTTTSTEEAILTVTASGVGISEDRREVIEVRQFAVEPATVRVNAGVTKSLSQFEFLRVDVSIAVPCYVEEIEQVLANVSDLVADALDEEVEKYLGNEEGK